MAQHNIAHFYGIVQVDPLVNLDEDNKPVAAIMYLLTMDSERRSQKLAVVEDINKLNQIKVVTRDPDIAAQISHIKQYDAVIIKGTLNTRNVEKAIVCENCGQRFPVNAMKESSDPNALSYMTSMITFVTPIAMEVVKTENTKDEAGELLLKNREMSNEIQVIGNLCADPVSRENGLVTAYQVGVNRKYYLKDDDPSVYADYPYIRSYGAQAEADIDALHKGSMILIDGKVKMRKFSRHSTCPYCQTSKEWKDGVLEIIPYSVEYLANYKTGREIAEEKNMEQEF